MKDNRPFPVSPVPGEASEGKQPSRWAGALAGIVAGGVAVGIGQLIAGFVSPEASPVVVVGQAAIDLTPEWLKQWAIRTFGAQDKTVLLLGIGAVLLGLAIVLGIASVRRPMVGLAGLGVLALVGMSAALTRPCCFS